MLPPRKRKRPRGLWKERVMANRTPALHLHERKQSGSLLKDDDDDLSQASSSSSKRIRRSSSLDTLIEIDNICDWSNSPRFSPYSDSIDIPEASQKIMDISSTAGAGKIPQNPNWTYEDWEDLMELFSQATEQYENYADASAAEALSIIRGVIHECHRFMLTYPDPTPLITHPPQKHRSPATPLEESSSSVLLRSSSEKPSKSTSVELPTAFHVILGTVLFMFGNLIQQNPEEAAPGEPDTPSPYWLAALDVFETGESLPSRTSGRGPEIPDDWRMAIVWGRTLVCIAEEILTRQEHAKREGKSSATCDSSPSAQFFAEDPEWPSESPFSVIVSLRPPITRRMSLSTASPNEIMVLAMDQFSRGIFRMPHRPQQVQALIVGADSFSRPKELFQIASEVLTVAEKLPLPAERQSWAIWADGVFDQMKMEADMDAWRGPINRARGRCWLLVGTALSEEFETAMEDSAESLTSSPTAKQGREALLKALAFFEKAKGHAVDEDDKKELQDLLAETLLDLGNLAPTKEEQDQYYNRANVEGGQDYLMGEEDSEQSDCDSDGDELMHDG
ncbi:hypothetical protein H0H93_004800 [Arthromyces matolae]|nr:hypothetical protein H0H93_004800 [Arthromyces matolae]